MGELSPQRRPAVVRRCVTGAGVLHCSERNRRCAQATVSVALLLSCWWCFCCCICSARSDQALAVAVIAWLVLLQQPRSSTSQVQFGPEYGRTVHAEVDHQRCRNGLSMTHAERWPTPIRRPAR